MSRRLPTQAALPGFDLAPTAAPPPDPATPRISARRCYPPRSSPRSALYRYRLEVDFAQSEAAHRLLVIGVNPSTADEQSDDATMVRVIARAAALGFGGVDMGNLFGIRSTDPDLRPFGDPVGPENDGELYRMAARASGILVAWGNAGLYQGRSTVVGGALARVAAAHTPLRSHCEKCGQRLFQGDRFCRLCSDMQSVTAPRRPGIPMWCFKVTKLGQPEHPLYQRTEARLVPWSPPPVAFKCTGATTPMSLPSGRQSGRFVLAPQEWSHLRAATTPSGAPHLWRSRARTPGCLVCGAVPSVAHLSCPGASR